MEVGFSLGVTVLAAEGQREVMAGEGTRVETFYVTHPVWNNFIPGLYPTTQ